MYLVEYSVVQGFHYNYLEPNGITFHNELFTNNYNPICIIEQELARNDEFCDFTNALWERGTSWKHVYSLVNAWLINYKEGKILRLNGDKLELYRR